MNTEDNRRRKIDVAHDRMIVPLDGGSVAERAIPVAAALAASAELPMTLVTVLSDSDLEDNAIAYLKAQAEKLSGRRVDYEVLWGIPAANTLVEYLHRHPRCLVCCSTHARLNTRQFMLGSVAEELVRRASVPVVLVGPRADLPAPHDRYGDVVVCVADESAHRLVPYVRELSAGFDLQPSLMQVLPPSFGAARREHGVRQSVLLESLSNEFYGDGSKPDWEAVEDRNVPLAITTFARQHGAPLLTLSSRRRYPEERYEESSVTVAIARIATCPVLVVGPAVPISRPAAPAN